MKENKFSLYTLDKKICQMIVDIEKISSDLRSENINLFTTTGKKMEMDMLKNEYEILFNGAKDLITELFVFKQKLNEYQYKRSKTHLNEVFETLASSKKDIEKLKEEKRRRILSQENKEPLENQPSNPQGSQEDDDDDEDLEDDEVVTQSSNSQEAKVVDTPSRKAVLPNGMTIQEANILWSQGI